MACTPDVINMLVLEGACTEQVLLMNTPGGGGGGRYANDLVLQIVVQPNHVVMIVSVLHVVCFLQQLREVPSLACRGPVTLLACFAC
jgi:hypothetical protein